MKKRYAIWDLKAKAFTATTVSMSIDSQVTTLCIRVFDTKDRAELAIKSAVYQSDPRYQVRAIGTSDAAEEFDNDTLGRAEEFDRDTYWLNP